MILSQGAPNIVSVKTCRSRWKHTDVLYYAGFGEIRVQEEMSTLARGAVNKITYLWDNLAPVSSGSVQKISKHGREERKLNSTISKPGNDP